MNSKRIESQLRAANPVSNHALEALDLGAGEAALGEALVAESAVVGEPGIIARAPGRRRPLLLLGAGATAAAVVVAAVVLLSGGAGRSPEPAYGADLVRYAESTPLLLLELPGWKVKDLEQEHGGDGDLGFVTDQGPVKQRWVKLSWLSASQPGFVWKAVLHPRIDRTPGRRFTTRPENLDAIVHVDTRAESAPQYGRAGDYEMSAIWKEKRRVVYMTTRVPSVAAFLERLEGLRKVDAQTWLDAMPPRVVKAAEYAPTVKEMLKGIPLPPGFDPSQVPHRGLSQDRYDVGAIVGGAVACAWFRNWGEARADRDTAAAAEAERVLLGSEKQWPIFREMAKEGAYPATVIEYARKMHSGRWYGKPLLAAVDSKEGLCGTRGDAASGG